MATRIPRVTSYTRAPKKGTPQYEYWLLERKATFDSLAADFRRRTRVMYAVGALDELPREQFALYTHGKPFDFSFARHKLLVELDGLSYDPQKPMGHQTAQGHDRDCRKDAEAVCAGWRVLRLTRAMLDDGTGYQYLERALGVRWPNDKRAA